MYWYQKAAEQGHAVAQYSLGLCYYKHGRGVKKDRTKSVYWYRKAAEQGYAEAQVSLGYCYDQGEGVEQDLSEAVYWYQKAADQGHATGQFNLGVCYANGRGVNKDLDLAAYWYTQSAEQGDEDARRNLYILQNNGQAPASGANWGDVLVAIGNGINQVAASISSSGTSGSYTNSYNNYAGGNNYNYSGSGNGGSDNSLKEKSKEVQRKTDYLNSGAYKTASKAFNKWEDTLSDMKINPEHYSHLSKEQFCREVKKAQNEMKKIRQQMAQYGFNQRVSSFESWVPDACR